MFFEDQDKKMCLIAIGDKCYQILKNNIIGSEKELFKNDWQNERKTKKGKKLFGVINGR